MSKLERQAKSDIPEYDSYNADLIKESRRFVSTEDRR